jgi:hypothetical protein
VARIHIGLYLARRGDLDAALEHLKRATRLAPPNKTLLETIQKIEAWKATH